jgi:hypothetical protein
MAAEVYPEGMRHRNHPVAAFILLAAVAGCEAPHGPGSAGVEAAQSARVDPPIGYENGVYRGFDRNEYPGDATMAAMHGTFAFTGYWLTNPPGEDSNTWSGKRTVLEAQGWGFLVLANGRLDAEILRSQKRGTSPAMLAQHDAAIAVAAAKSEGFPPQTILFLDQEEGGRLLEEQAQYLLAWTEQVASSGFRAGLYASGQPVPDGPGKTITTIDDVRSQVSAKHLHAIAMFDAQDACPPAPGCSLQQKPLASSGEMDLTVWQYAQSPRRPAITKACGKTYSTDGNCYAPGFPSVFLDMDAASSADPSGGR